MYAYTIIKMLGVLSIKSKISKKKLFSPVLSQFNDVKINEILINTKITS